MKRFLKRTGIFLLLVVSMSLLVVSAYNLYSINQAENELYAMKRNTEPQKKEVEGKSLTVKVTPQNLSKESFWLDVPEVLQRPSLPQGCEIAALSALLRHYGYENDPVQMARNYLPKEEFVKENGKNFGASPHRAYAGNPEKESGWFCYAQPIVKAANAYFEAENIWDRAEDFSGSTRDKIINAVHRGDPVLIWVTTYLEPLRTMPGWYDKDSKEQIEVPLNSHCVVLNGFSGQDLLIMDPLQGEVRVDANQLFESYYELGGYAVKLERN